MADEEAKAEAFGVTSGNTTTFSQLLFSADEKDPIFNSNFSIDYPSKKMICFGMKEESILLSEPSLKIPPQSSGITCSDSSSLSSGNKSNSKLKKRNGLEELDQENDAIKVAQKASKKIKADSSGSAVHGKRKEKLGERITALQQLVSPFGKTDTASVLHEAMGYIKFLQEQVHVLCSPYLQHLPIISPTGRKVREREEEVKSKKKELSLRSRGLCLIPVECSLHLANCNAADFWSPLMGKKL